MLKKTVILIVFAFIIFNISCSSDSTSSDNTAPTASFTVSPSSGDTLTTFQFNASGSSDAEDPTSSLQVRWDWESDGTWDTGYSTAKTENHQYNTTGDKTITLEVKDMGGLTASTTDQVLVTELETGTVTDIDGHVYKTIKMGNQWWMAENLKVTHYSNGDTIPEGGIWSNLTTGAYCNYILDSVVVYGRLYNWYSVNDSRNIAPAGWHVPTDEDWKQLEMYLGMSQLQADGTGWRGYYEGGKLKDSGTTHWISSDTSATNESGFTALPGGCRFDTGLFGLMTRHGFWWSTTEFDADHAWYRALRHDESAVYRANVYHKRCGFSVRCVMD